MSLILNQSQAEAVYSAMCALNNVGGRVSAQMGAAYAAENSDGEVCVELGPGACQGCERYANQAAFAAAYGLDGKEPRTAVYTAGIGWQVQDQHGRRGNFNTEAEALAA